MDQSPVSPGCRPHTGAESFGFRRLVFATNGTDWIHVVPDQQMLVTLTLGYFAAVGKRPLSQPRM